MEPRASSWYNPDGSFGTSRAIVAVMGYRRMNDQIPRELTLPSQHWRPTVKITRADFVVHCVCISIRSLCERRVRSPLTALWEWHPLRGFRSVRSQTFTTPGNQNEKLQRSDLIPLNSTLLSTRLINACHATIVSLLSRSASHFELLNLLALSQLVGTPLVLRYNLQ